MTYIEFFEKNASENISACLSRAPERVIYIGNNAKLMQKHIAAYQRVFQDRGYQIEMLYRTVSRSNLQYAVKLLTEIVEQYDDCAFDITGGEEILLLALGIVYAKYPEKNIQIHRFNLQSNTIHDCDKDGVTLYRDAPKLTVEEHIRIHGGDILYGSAEEPRTYKWQLDEAFCRDIQQMWEICREDVRNWNVQINMLEAADAVGRVSKDGLTTKVSRKALLQHLPPRRAKYKKPKGVVESLLEAGLLTAFEDSDGDTVVVTYKNAQVKRCLTKAGQVLEMKVYTTALGLRDKYDNLIYNDALNGVVLDWDGDLRPTGNRDRYDTENEIDVLLMRGVVPVFISCKNGIVTPDELYKLSTVAERFGGQYSQKVLVATALSKQGKAGNHIRQRAKDMNIQLLENIQNMDEAEFARRLGSLWST